MKACSQDSHEPADLVAKFGSSGREKQKDLMLFSQKVDSSLWDRRQQQYPSNQVSTQ